MSTVKSPILFVQFDVSEFVQFRIENNIIDEYTYTPSISEQGDECHVDIIGMVDKHTEKFSSKTVVPSRLSLCSSEFDIEGSTETEILAFLADARSKFSTS